MSGFQDWQEIHKMSGPTTKFVSQKMSKIRWRTNPKQSVHFSEVFATGSWDDEVQNSVILWTLESGDHDTSDNMMGGGDEPHQLCSFAHQGDVMDLQFITSNLLATGSSNGSVHLLKHHDISQTLSSVHNWDKLHHLKHSACACNGIATRGEDGVVSVGEDGRIHVLNIEQRAPVRTIEKADSCSINGVSFMRQFEIATINSMGQLKVWDVRHQNDDPVRILHMTGNQVPLHCLDKHPTQPHILVTGSQEGSLCIWDMRQDRVPVALLTASESEMWEVRFHPSQPDNLLTCHGNGSVFLWNSSAVNTPLVTLPKGPSSNTTMIGGKPTSGDHVASPWLACDAAKNRLDITELLSGNRMPINSLDIIDTTLLCATDCEQILTLRGVPIK